MRAKPVLIIFGILVLGTGIFLFARSRSLIKPDQNEVAQFLKRFDANLEAGNIDSLKSYMETNQHSKIVNRLLNILSNKNASDGKSKSLFPIRFNTDSARITILGGGMVQAIIPAVFKHKKIAEERTWLVLKMHKSDATHYKILQIDARRLLNDMIVYENRIKRIGANEKDIYSAITLASFKVAASLKPKYDSVLYFQHIGGKTWYYVVKGKFRRYSVDGSGSDTADDYKIGLVGPDLKEIIPVKYTLIHNINGTIDGLIEVEDGNKRGLFDITGKNVLPVEYEQVFPLVDDANLALLQKDDDYYYLKKDMTVSDKLTDIKIGDELKKVKNFDSSFTLEDGGSDDIMEYNDRDDYTSLIISPSYMVDLGILPKYITIANHLRKYVEDPNNDEEEDNLGSDYYKVTFDGSKTDDKSWFETAYYSVVDNYLGGRAGLYSSKNMLVIDKKKNKILQYRAEVYFPARDGGGQLSGLCNDNSLRQLNDTLFELKTTNIAGTILNGVELDEFPRYTYLHLVKGKLTALPNERFFGFTQYVKMDDSYLEGCYLENGKPVDHVSTELLQYMKNEIFASYGFRFKTDKWAKEFENRFYFEEKDRHDNVNDSLTVIDKYNINWISQKLKATAANTLASK